MAVGVAAGAAAGAEGVGEEAREEAAMAARGARAALGRGRVSLEAVGAGGVEGGTVGTVVAAGSGAAVWAKIKTAAGSVSILCRWSHTGMRVSSSTVGRRTRW